MALQGLVVLALVLATTAFVALDKTVSLSVDGQEREVRSFARTVGDLLHAQGIAHGERDVVSPSPDTTLDDGDRVVVRYGRLLSLTVDGQTRDVWTTALTVDEALSQLGIRADGAVLSASRSQRIDRRGLDLDLRMPRGLTITADGTSVPLTTTAATVGDALAEAGITLGERDTVSPQADEPTVDGQSVTVTRVEVREVTEQQEVAFTTQRRDDPTLLTGTTRRQQRGAVGAKELTYAETVVDGEVGERTLVSEVVTREPVTEVVLVGTKPKPRPRPSSPPTSRPSPKPKAEAAPARRASTPKPSRSASRSAAPAPQSGGGLNWAALARCESGGNPSIVSANGLYHGLYQFHVDTWRAVGGSGVPSQASAAEQTKRAQILYSQAGRSPWPTCGKHL
jgi:uncharacterized protein YabE (DUF348 family)